MFDVIELSYRQSLRRASGELWHQSETVLSAAKIASAMWT